MITQIENTIKEKKKYGAMRETKSEKNLINEKKKCLRWIQFLCAICIWRIKDDERRKKKWKLLLNIVHLWYGRWVNARIKALMMNTDHEKNCCKINEETRRNRNCRMDESKTSETFSNRFDVRDSLMKTKTFSTRNKSIEYALNLTNHHP